MSTITAINKVNSHGALNNRNLILIAVGLLVLMLTVIAAVSMTSPAAKPFDDTAYRLYRQGEWVSVPVSNAEAYQIFRRGEVASPVSHAEAYQIFRSGEVTSPLSSAEAYQLYRQGEWTSVEAAAADLSTYHLSERDLINPNAGMAIYLQSERTLIDPQAGLAAYFASERNSIPVSFTQYQLSEWFGK
jgi:hypothetical protein